MRRATARARAEILAERVFEQVGAPAALITDRGKQFDSAIFQELLARYSIRWTPTAAYHPQANPSEAANKTIGNGLKDYIRSNRHHRDWADNLA